MWLELVSEDGNASDLSPGALLAPPGAGHMLPLHLSSTASRPSPPAHVSIALELGCLPKSSAAGIEGHMSGKAWTF